MVDSYAGWKSTQKKATQEKVVVIRLPTEKRGSKVFFKGSSKAFDIWRLAHAIPSGSVVRLPA